MIALRSPDVLRRVLRAASPAAARVTLGVRLRVSLGVTLGVTATLAALPAAAQDRATASALFDKGLAAMKAKDFAVGCPALAESLKIDPLPGTLFTLAECEASSGATASAMLHYADFLAAVQAMPSDAQRKQQPRVDRTNAQRKALEKTVAHLTLTLPKDAPAGAVVKRDGMTVPVAAYGMAVAIDPGPHTIVVEAPNRSAKEQKVDVLPGKDQTITLAFGAITGGTATTAQPIAATTASPFPPRPEGPAKKPVVGYVVLGVGGAALVTGGVFGVLAVGKKGVVKDNCQGAVCNQQGKDAGDSLNTFSTVSTIGVAVGVVGVGVGTFLLLRSPKKETAFTIAPSLAVTGARDGFGGIVGTF